MTLKSDPTTYEAFRTEWVSEIEDAPNTVEKGRQFAIKLAGDWLDVDPNEDDFHYVDGSGDGGIDIAYLHRSPSDNTELSPEIDNAEKEGDTWYLFQSKYGTAIQGSDVIVREAKKVFATLFGDRKVSNDAADVVERLQNFMRQRSDGRDRLVLVIASVDPLDEKQSAQLDEVRQHGRDLMSKRGPTFDVESATVHRIFEISNERDQAQNRIVLELPGQFSELAPDAQVGTVSLFDLYEFLKAYRTKSGELDRLYEKNVRRWLGMTKSQKVNWGITKTLNENPNRFGLYNNGITFVADAFKQTGSSNVWTISNPYVVNGCQTTRTLFGVADPRLDGGTGDDDERDAWKLQLQDSSLVVKVVTIDDPKELLNITRFTNSQSAVRDRDLVSLDKHYNRWQVEMSYRHVRYLEIQRGGWNSRKGFEKQHPDASPRFTAVSGAREIKANDMLKLFGAAWLGYAGSAARRSEDFIPSPMGEDAPGNAGRVFRKIVALEDFSADDLLAADHLFAWGKQERFGGRGVGISRSYTRYLFYYTYVQLLRTILATNSSPETVPTHVITQATLRLAKSDGFSDLCRTACQVIDGYVNDDPNAPIFNDPGYLEAGTVEVFFKSERLDSTNIQTKAPNYINALGQTTAGMAISFGGQPTIMDGYREALTDLLV
ncbi:MAG: AIPR family protein [Chloroflexi bacterium]|nr:AIPR family protein [Chloroflexota bacterium]